MYHACGGVLRGSVPCSAVPVLEAICTPGRAPVCAVRCSEAIISSVNVFAIAGVTAWPMSSGVVVDRFERSGPLRLSTRCGCISTPLLATAAATIAFCSGVMATSFCPMLDMATAASSDIGPTVEVATWSGMESSSRSRPNACAALTSLSRLSCSAPNLAKAVLQERANASFKEVVSPPPQEARL
ncbi:Uncharacterised protein [Mycobacteroides abscessus subsp. abscessus]|nr:Uncharacterised protein [Mycobacteroides abscessus subsp. abscessus]SKU64806.1 Uncharacterised protein [Mycobacteroides abscessus subsp. abscessus]